MRKCNLCKALIDLEKPHYLQKRVDNKQAVCVNCCTDIYKYIEKLKGGQ